MDALYNPASVDYHVYRMLTTDRDSDSRSSCVCHREPPELSDAAKARIQKRTEEVGKMVEEFKNSPLGKTLMIKTSRTDQW